MNCPVCRKPLVVLEWDTVEVDYCLACQGIWLDAGELEILFGDDEACKAFLDAGGDASPRAHGEKRRRCPACDATMVKALTGGKAPVLYDRCHRGHGLWFDRGELQEVLHNGVGSNRVDNFLRHMFNSPGAEPGQDPAATRPERPAIRPANRPEGPPHRPERPNRPPERPRIN